MAKAGADVFVMTPHFSSHNSYVDPTHRYHLAAGTFPHMCGDGRFEVVDLQLTFGGNLILDNLGRAVSRLSLKWYERHAAWTLPALDIGGHMRVVK